jgi:hypothetical protein
MERHIVMSFGPPKNPYDLSCYRIRAVALESMAVYLNEREEERLRTHERRALETTFESWTDAVGGQLKTLRTQPRKRSR